MSQFDELREKFKKTPEEQARIQAKIDAENKRKDEIKRMNQKQKFNDYINSLPFRFKDASFENFIIRKDGGLLEERKKIEKLKGGLIFGVNGNGKTHLGYAACRRIVENGGTAKLIRAFNFFTEIKACYSSNKSVNEVIEKYADFDYLAIDECDKTRQSQDEYVNLIELVNRRYDAMKPTLIISNLKTIDEVNEVLTFSCTDKVKENCEIEMTYGSTRDEKTQTALKEKQKEINKCK